MNLTVGLVVYNEEQRLPDLFDVCDTFADELLVVDQSSTDDTLAICNRYGATVVSDRCHGYADPSRSLLIEHCPTEWMLMIDADEMPTLGFRHAVADLMTSTGVYLKRENRIGRIYYSEEFHYRLFPTDNVSVASTLHAKSFPLSPIGVVTPQFVALDHHKTIAEQERDDLAYEQLGQTDHKILDRLRTLGISGETADLLPVEERKRIVLG